MHYQDNNHNHQEISPWDNEENNPNIYYVQYKDNQKTILPKQQQPKQLQQITNSQTKIANEKKGKDNLSYYQERNQMNKLAPMQQELSQLSLFRTGSNFMPTQQQQLMQNTYKNSRSLIQSQEKEIGARRSIQNTRLLEKQEQNIIFDNHKDQMRKGKKKKVNYVQSIINIGKVKEEYNKFYNQLENQRKIREQLNPLYVFQQNQRNNNQQTQQDILEIDEMQMQSNEQSFLSITNINSHLNTHTNVNANVHVNFNLNNNSILNNDSINNSKQIRKSSLNQKVKKIQQSDFKQTNSKFSQNKQLQDEQTERNKQKQLLIQNAKIKSQSLILKQQQKNEKERIKLMEFQIKKRNQHKQFQQIVQQKQNDTEYDKQNQRKQQFQTVKKSKLIFIKNQIKKQQAQINNSIQNQEDFNTNLQDVLKFNKIKDCQKVSKEQYMLSQKSINYHEEQDSIENKEVIDQAMISFLKSNYNENDKCHKRSYPLEHQYYLPTSSKGSEQQPTQSCAKKVIDDGNDLFGIRKLDVQKAQNKEIKIDHIKMEQIKNNQKKKERNVVVNILKIINNKQSTKKNGDSFENNKAYKAFKETPAQKIVHSQVNDSVEAVQ